MVFETGTLGQLLLFSFEMDTVDIKLQQTSQKATASKATEQLEALSIQHSTHIDEVSSSAFTPFPQLPFELRLKIWHHAQPSPRVIELFWEGSLKTSANSCEPAPVLLHVCRESRNETLKIFRLVSRNSDDSTVSRGTKDYRRPIYIDAARDILFIKRSQHSPPLEDFVEEFHNGLLCGLQKLAMDMCIMEDATGYEDDSTGIEPLKALRTLKFLTVVLIVGYRRHVGAITFTRPFGIEERRPPRLPAPEDARIALFLPEERRFARHPRDVLEDKHFELEVGGDRVEELEENLDFWYRMVDKVGEMNADWKSLKIRYGSLRRGKKVLVVIIKVHKWKVEQTSCSRD